MERNEPKASEASLEADIGANPDRSLRALLLVEAVASADVPLSLAQLCDRLETPKATLLRMLVALERLGYLLREVDDKTYGLGPRASRLGLSLLRNDSVLARHRLVLQALVQQLGETCNLTALDGDSVIYIDRVETREPLRLHVQPGTHVPLHCTASGKLFLAEMQAEQRSVMLKHLALTPQTDRSITDVALLETELERTRARGVGVDCEEFVRGMVAVAVPIRSAQGQCLAALACHAPTARKSINDLIEYIPQLQAAAAQLAHALAL